MRFSRAFSLIEVVVALALVILIGAGAGYFAAGSGDPSAPQTQTALWAVANSASDYRNHEGRLPAHPQELRWPSGASVPVTDGAAHGFAVSVDLQPADDRVRAAGVDRDGDCWFITRNFAASSAENGWIYAAARTGSTTPCSAEHAPVTASAGTPNNWAEPIELP